jgi:hypothetical protein
MHKIHLLTVVILSGIYTSAQSPKKQSQNSSNILKLGLNTFFDSDEFPLSVNWETKVGPNQSIQIGVLPRIRKYNTDKTSGVGINFAYRKYISKNHTGISGLFLSPLIKVGFLNTTNSYTNFYGGNPPQVYTSSSTSKINQFNLGFVFGHSWVFKSGFSFEGSGGFGYYNSRNTYTSNTTGSQAYNSKSNSSGILPQVQINFGYAF